MGNDEIDDSLYSRQRYVLGDSAMQKLAKSNVLIIGLGGVGVEVAKNIILAGVKSVTFHDNRTAQASDLGVQFFLREKDVDDNLSRSQACYKRLAELNPYVTVRCTKEDVLKDLELLKSYQCVVSTELTFNAQIGINNFCRNQTPPIPFISCNVKGVFSYLFCDFGNEFEVHDSDGEEPKEIFIKSISKENQCVITTLDHRRHELETGHVVCLKEIKGMSKLNGKCFKIKYINPYSFSIDCDTTSDEYELHTNGGACIRTKQTTRVNCKSLETQLKAPEIMLNDLSKLDNPLQVLIGLIGVEKYYLQNSDRVCNNMEKYLEVCDKVNEAIDPKQDNLDVNILKTIAKMNELIFAPLCAAIGGVASQEVLKSISGKFTPLKQWLLIDCMELCADLDLINNDSLNLSHRCLSSELVNHLTSLKLFMVGCGAIGCEMLKNLAILGIGSGMDGLITIADNDLIEKSNLNRQFLFRPWHIQKSKAVIAAESVLEINPDLHIQALQQRVCPATQSNIFNDRFFTQQNIVVNALDNVEARRYVDGRCVSNQRPLIETGTMGAKGHVQVIVPHLTESYTTQRDPIEEDVPYCTLKSFPQVIEHTIQWARDKFESIFTLKPTQYNKFWETNSGPSQLGKGLDDNSPIPEGFVDAVRLLQNKPTCWEDCVTLARSKFEIYFNHKARQLLDAFPVDTVLPDGGLFWQSPKRPPTPVNFDTRNSLHMDFVISYSRILAHINGIKLNQDMDLESFKSILLSCKIPQYTSSGKKIETDETKTKSEGSSEDDDLDKISKLIRFLKTQNSDEVLQVLPESFEKDDDSNEHVTFVTSASNLRATMYGIEIADRYKTKRIAGRIIPAIATTTAAIAGLATIELLKVVGKQKVENLKNCFLNLALPMMVLSEPGAPPKTKIRNDLEYSLWDRWDIQGHKDFKLKDFNDYLKKKYNLNVNMVVVEGSKMIYVPIMPGHKKRVNDLMTKLLKPKKGALYVDVYVSFDSGTGTDDEEDLPAPPIRYFYNL